MIKGLPILGFQDNDIGVSDSSLDRWVDDAHSGLDSAKEKNPSSVQARAVGKFTIENAEIEGVNTYVVYLKTKPVGLLLLHRNDDQVWATETIGVLPEYQGQNLGTLLYETALADIGRIGSSTSLSGGSSKLWKALCVKHKGVFVIPGGRSGSFKPLEVRISGWVIDAGVTYPTFATSKGTKSLREIIKAAGFTEGDAAKEGYYLIKAFGSSSKIAEVWPF
jgi:GNAT superfamily N-acetyltransferase